MTGNKLLIYSENDSNRLRYVTALIFTELLGIEWELTQDLSVYQESSDAKINYSNNAEIPGLVIKPNSLLFEKDIKQVSVSLDPAWSEIPTISLDQQPFDVFAASFYLVSRYEEYDFFTPDAHNRFPAEASCLTQLNLLQKPLVNLWAIQLYKELVKAFPNLKASPRSFEFISTIDIDQAWKYKYKGFSRTIGGFLRDLISGNFSLVKQRLDVLSNKKADPFYNFNWQNNLHAECKTQVQYFFQVGKRGEFDKNTDSNVQDFQSLIKDLDNKHHVGIHPSYHSNTNNALVAEEIQTLQNILQHPIQVSRQHFLKLRMPQTYQTLLSNGIKEEHSLGYTSHTGFRAGIAAPFKFFDLSTNTATDLTCIPFALMDITSLHYSQHTAEEAIAFNKELIDEVKAVDGLLASLWHNESLSEDGRWKNWRCVYERLIKDVSKAVSS